MERRNLHPVDELSEVRSRIRNLKVRESELRKKILSDEVSLNGDFHFCSISTQERRSFDRKAAEQELGSLSRYDRFSKVQIIKINPKAIRDDD